MSYCPRSRPWLVGLTTTLLVVAGCGRASLPADDEAASPKPPPNTATSEQWKNQPAANAEELFAGRFAGVQVFRVPDGIAVRIRGSTSVMGSNEPLYIVDGMTIEPGPGGALVGINPADIEKIEVLKDIGSTSLYGVRGANGVIMITTKRGR